MSIRTIYGFDEDGKKVPIGSYSDSVTVTLDSNISTSYPLGGGPYTSLTGAGQYDIGDSCTIVAPQVASGYPMYFTAWTSDSEGQSVVSSNREYTFTVTGDITLYAYYVSGGVID